MCVNHTMLNSRTTRHSYLLLRTDDHLEKLMGCNFYSVLDLASRYHQILMSEDSVSKTPFVTLEGHYEYLRMPFDFVRAPAVFQRTLINLLDS